MLFVGYTSGGVMMIHLMVINLIVLFLLFVVYLLWSKLKKTNKDLNLQKNFCIKLSKEIVLSKDEIAQLKAVIKKMQDAEKVNSIAIFRDIQGLKTEL